MHEASVIDGIGPPPDARLAPATVRRIVVEGVRKGIPFPPSRSGPHADVPA